MLSPSVRRRSVMFVCPTQVVEIFGNVSTPLANWPSVDIHGKFYANRPETEGTPPSSEDLNERRITKSSNFGPIEG